MGIIGLGVVGILGAGRYGCISEAQLGGHFSTGWGLITIVQDTKPVIFVEDSWPLDSYGGG